MALRRVQRQQMRRGWSLLVVSLVLWIPEQVLGARDPGDPGIGLLGIAAYAWAVGFVVGIPLTVAGLVIRKRAKHDPSKPVRLRWLLGVGIVALIVGFIGLVYYFVTPSPTTPRPL